MICGTNLMKHAQSHLWFRLSSTCLGRVWGILVVCCCGFVSVFLFVKCLPCGFFRHDTGFFFFISRGAVAAQALSAWLISFIVVASKAAHGVGERQPRWQHRSLSRAVWQPRTCILCMHNLRLQEVHGVLHWGKQTDHHAPLQCITPYNAFNMSLSFILI